MQDKALDSHVNRHAKGNRIKKEQNSHITFTQNEVHCGTIRTLLAIFMILYDRAIFTALFFAALILT